MATAQIAAVAMRYGKPRVSHLRSRLAAKLTGGLEKQVHAAPPRVIGGKAAAVGIERRLTRVVEPQPRAFYEIAAFALLGEAEVLEASEDGDGERVVHHRHVHLLRTYACLPKSERSGD